MVVDAAERILLVKRAAPPREGLWCLPGGFMELGETPEQTALRELQEESGLAGQIEALLGITSQESPMYGSVLITGFLVRGYTGTLTAGDDASAADFFPMDGLPEIAFGSHRRFVRLYHAEHAGLPSAGRK